MTGEKIDWYEQLKSTLETERCVPVRVHAEGQSIEGTVQACRLPPAQAAEARRRLPLPPMARATCVSPVDPLRPRM
ncbi:MAG: hypothetical protein ACFCVA_00390 [Gammaproteobacteria bacterium]